MRIKDNYMLREIAGEWLVIAKGTEALQFNSTVLLNETGAFLWKLLADSDQTKESLISALMCEYEVHEDRAKIDIDVFIEKLAGDGLLEDQ